MEGSKRRSRSDFDFGDTSCAPEKKKTTTKHQLIFYKDVHVLISGIGGVGAQLAKCLVHAGVHSLTLQDEGDVSWSDLSSNPFATEADIGKNRASVCAHKLRKLNTEVQINVLPSRLQKPDQLSGFQAVILTNHCVNQETVSFSEYCHTHSPPIFFIMTQVAGLFGRVFCDFGPQFNCNVVKPKPICDHGDGRSVATIKEDPPYILDRSATSSLILSFMDEARALPGECDHCKTLNGFAADLQLHFLPLRRAIQLVNPIDHIVGATNQQRPLVLHAAFIALDIFIQQNGRLPGPDSAQDSNHFCFLASTLMTGEDPSIDTFKEVSLLQQFSTGSTAVIGPMASVFAAIVGQEVIKALSRESQPIFQFFYFDSLECLPPTPATSGVAGSSNPGCSSRGSRYDAQILLFGRDVQTKLQGANLLVVGDGVLGCELMRNLALMGASSGSSGKMSLAHRIPGRRNKISYCGRHTLFEDSYQAQSIPCVATASALSVNDSLNLHVLPNKLLGEQNNLLHIYEDAFWESLDTIVDATNEVQSIKRMSNFSKDFRKKLLVPLISGAQCHSIVQLPRQSKSWEKVLTQFPFCWRIRDQYLAWSWSEFEGCFMKMPRNVNMFLSDHDSFLSAVSGFSLDDPQSRDVLIRIIDCLEAEWCKNFKDCVIWARKKFEVYFVEYVLLHLKYLDNSPYPPQPIKFSASDIDHLSFVKSASILRAKTYGIKIPSSIDWAQEMEWLQAQDFSLKQNFKAAVAEASVDSLIRKAEELAQQLPPGFEMTTIPFNVDDGFHMTYIRSMFNLMMSEQPFMLYEDRGKEVLQRCFPMPHVTSCTLAAGLSCLKLYKLIGASGEDLKNLQNVESDLESSFFSKYAAIKS